jgi:hypothetical protein
MLLVVFGAGASYDSASALRADQRSATWRPPLANQLFDLGRFGGYISQFPRCAPIITYLQGPDVNVEQRLEKYQSEQGKDPERVRQLTAIRYYLQTMLSELVVAWHGETSGVTNYKSLLDQIRHERKPGEKVCLVTFNYDTLLEDALSIVNATPKSMRDYVAGDYLVIKLHGSINWVHQVDNFRGDVNKAPIQVISEIIDEAPNLLFNPGHQPISATPLIQRRDNPPFVPALSIPVEHKPGYECPAEHIQALEEVLPAITKVLVIGWRAADEPFLKLMAEKMVHVDRMMMISSSETKANEIISRIRNAGVAAQQYLPAKGGGFSQAVLSGQTEAFLKS